MEELVFQRSVLPLADDGSVYHLRLLPGELADTIFFVGDADRVPMVSACFDRVELTRQHREFTTHTGWLNDRRVSVVSTGIGSSGVEIALNEIDALHNIDLVERKAKPNPVSLNFIRIGTCGALDESLLPGSRVVSHAAVGFDGSMSHYDVPLSERAQQLQSVVMQAFYDYPQKASAYAAVSSPRLQQALSSLGQSGITLTCPGFYAAQHRRLRLPIAPRDVLALGQGMEFEGHRVVNFEMETAMLLGLGAALGHHCASVSLVVYNRVTEQGLENATQAMSELIDQVLSCAVFDEAAC